MHQEKDLFSKLEEAGYGDAAEKMGIYRQESIHIATAPRQEADFALGESKIGGVPHLPEGFDWPTYDGVPLYFVAQINLARLPDCKAAEQLPRSGILYFFYEGGYVWGFDPQDAGAAVVRHYDGDPSALHPRTMTNAEGESRVFEPPCAVTFSVVSELPTDADDVDMAAVLDGVAEEERGKATALIQECLEADEPAEGIINKLFGWPNLIQGEFFTESHLASNGIYAGDGETLEDPAAVGFAEQVSDWILLFQMDSDENAGMMWGDVGRLYYTMKKSDLAARKFDKIWFSMQCC